MQRLQLFPEISPSTSVPLFLLEEFFFSPNRARTLHAFRLSLLYLSTLLAFVLVTLGVDFQAIYKNYIYADFRLVIAFFKLFTSCLCFSFTEHQMSVACGAMFTGLPQQKMNFVGAKRETSKKQSISRLSMRSVSVKGKRGSPADCGDSFQVISTQTMDSSTVIPAGECWLAGFTKFLTSEHKMEF